MIYLYWYLGIGVVVLAVVYGAHRLTKEKKSESLRDLLEAVNPDGKKLSYRILNNFVAPVLAVILVVAVWPVVVYMQVKELFQKKESNGFPEEREFAVEREQLLERLTEQEIERREVVTDPLKAAPELPFGHLHAAWQEFLKGRADGAELWSFSARWQTMWGRKELRCGYVVVQDGAPGTHFLTVWKDIPDEAEADGSAKQERAKDIPG
ncbi:hypothetical protein SAMN05216404_10913 [Nitrosospira multiformis]|uniref:Uncharacterized protein n=1 Tax=Nitrosospira multiformis TaxID=1231 RepID=A0A1H8KQM1_9PROT|nr:hypothetical protein [Nitrosospira multiformis]SEN95199.1 hypothetical protein SAMN05216404_10913 [Nitrosospira multiformis]